MDAFVGYLTQIDLAPFVSKLTPIAVTLAAVGVLSMALWQFLKELLALHHFYNKFRIRRWILKAVATGDDDARATAAKLVADQVELQLRMLCTGGRGTAFYTLAAPQLAAQISAAAQVALEFPKEHRALFDCLTGDLGAEYLALLEKRPGARKSRGTRRRTRTASIRSSSPTTPGTARGRRAAPFWPGTNRCMDLSIERSTAVG